VPDVKIWAGALAAEGGFAACATPRLAGGAVRLAEFFDGADEASDGAETAFPGKGNEWAPRAACADPDNPAAAAGEAGEAGAGVAAVAGASGGGWMFGWACASSGACSGTDGNFVARAACGAVAAGCSVSGATEGVSEGWGVDGNGSAAAASFRLD
jgi:hypothetical protein